MWRTLQSSGDFFFPILVALYGCIIYYNSIFGFTIWIIIPCANFTNFRAIGDETISRAVFEEYVAWLQEKAKEKERRREEEKVNNNNILGVVSQSGDAELTSTLEVER